MQCLNWAVPQQKERRGRGSGDIGVMCVCVFVCTSQSTNEAGMVLCCLHVLTVNLCVCVHVCDQSCVFQNITQISRDSKTVTAFNVVADQ